MADSILQGMMAGMQFRQNREKMQLEQEQAQQHHELLQKQLEQENEWHAKQTDIEQQARDLQTALAKRQLEDSFNQRFGSQSQVPTSALNAPTQPQMLTQTGDVNTDIPQNAGAQPYMATPAQGYSGIYKKMFPEGISIDPNYWQSRLDILRKQGELESQQKIDTAKGQEQAKVEPQLQIAQGTEAIQQPGKERIANITAASRILDANIGASAVRYSADKRYDAAMRDAGMNSDDLSDFGVRGANGTLDIKLLPQKQRAHVMSVINSSGAKIPDQQDITSVKSLNDMDNIFDLMGQMKDKLSTSSSILSPSRISTFGQQHLPISTDLTNLQNQIMAQTPVIIKSMVGKGSGNRITQSEIQSVSKALASGSMNREQAEKNINDLQGKFYDQIFNTNLGSYSWNQKVSILEANNPSFLNNLDGKRINIKGRKNVPVMIHAGDGVIKLLDPSDLKYKTLGKVDPNALAQ